jgi:hypothetical protein
MRYVAASFAPMPETSINEDRDGFFGKIEVWRTKDGFRMQHPALYSCANQGEAK